MIKYEIKGDVQPEEIAESRKSVGWNGMEASLRKSLINSYFYICCFDDDKLIGYLDVVSNGVIDSYIQDVIVNPEYQRKGIGTKLMNMAIDKLKHDGIYSPFLRLHYHLAANLFAGQKSY